MRAHVFLYDGTWPFAMAEWLAKASSVEYGFQIGDVTTFSFDVPSNAGYRIEEGQLVGIRSPKGLPDFGGIVMGTKSSRSGGTITVHGEELMSLLDDRETMQEYTYPSGESGTIAREIIAQASGRNPTAIQLPNTGESQIIPAPFTVKAQSLRASLDALAQRTGWEYQLMYDAARVLSWSFLWLPQLGEDLSHRIHLAGPMIADYAYTEDAVTDAAIVRVVADQGDFGGRPSAVAVADVDAELYDIATLRVQSPANPNTRRLRGLSIATAREHSIIDLSIPDELEAQRRALEEIASVLNGTESVSVVVPPSIDWSFARLGNIITVRLVNARPGGHVIRRFRIYAIQPLTDHVGLELLGKVVHGA